ncbi:MAG: type I polyketide synthase, partial [Bryobacteraceae bacterium]
AHGTGTALGDPIEAHAFARVLGAGRTKENPLIVGSVKTNLGHLEAAAGIAGLIKLVLSLQNELIPKHLHLQKLNPHINWGSVPVEIPLEARPWKRGGTPRLAGVSSFGFSGTNAHLIVEEAPERKIKLSEPERPLQILALSARDEIALQQLGERYAGELSHTQATLADFCYTANAGRAQWRERTFCIASTRAGMRDALLSGKMERASTERAPSVVFLFSGQGSQYAGMGKELYETQPVFRSALDACARLLESSLEEPLTEVLWGRATALLSQTLYTQPALFALEYALAELWKSWGIAPAAVLGHSIGEYAAACVAGVYDLADGLKLIASRAKLMQSVAGDGVMTSARTTEAQARAVLMGLEGRVSIAAVNSPESVVISGFEPEVRTAEAALQAQGISLRRLSVSHAFHSPQMDEIETAFESVAAEIHYRAPQIPLISSVTGQPIAPTEMSGPLYWRRQVRQPVRFAGAMETLREQGYDAFLEIGPGATLLALGRQCIANEGPAGARLWAASLRQGRGEWAQILESLGRLYVRGAGVNWNGFDQPYDRRRVALPTYPFQRQRHWIETKKAEPLLSLEQRGAELGIECGLDRYESLRAELNPLCSDYVVSALTA